MQEILLIRGGPGERALDMLAVAAEASAVLGANTQIDVAVPAEFAELMRLSTVVRRVIAVAPPEAGGWAALTSPDDDGGSGLGGKLLSAAKKLSAAAGKNVRTYWQLLEEVRITQYDVVFDFEFSAFSMAVAKMAKTQKIVGFDAACLPATMPGAALSAHRTYLIKGEMSHSARMRRLLAKHYDTAAADNAARLDWRLRAGEAPPQSAPYALTSADLPPAFAEVLQQSGHAVQTVQDDMPPLTLAGWVQRAALVAGGGLVSALAAAYGVPTYHIGSRAADAPARATLITTPAALTQALATRQQALAARQKNAAAPPRSIHPKKKPPPARKP